MMDLGKGKFIGVGSSLPNYRKDHEFSASITSNTYNGKLEIEFKEHGVATNEIVSFKLDVKMAKKLHEYIGKHIESHNVKVVEKEDEIAEIEKELVLRKNELFKLKRG